MQKRVAGQVELLKNNDQRQMFAESCRNIRSSLLYMDRQGQRPRIIMLTSSMPSEGKVHTLRTNLAITPGDGRFAARCWWMPICAAASCTNALILKMISASPSTSKMACRLSRSSRIPAVLRISTLSPAASIRTSRVRAADERALRRIHCGAFFKEHYDFVIFDSPPILLTDDAASFATRADAVLFVVPLPATPVCAPRCVPRWRACTAAA